MSKTPKDLEQMQTKLKAKEASLKPLAAKDPKAAGALIAIQKSLKKVGDALVDFGDYTASQATGSQTRKQKKARDELEKRVTASRGMQAVTSTPDIFYGGGKDARAKNLPSGLLGSPLLVIRHGLEVQDVDPVEMTRTAGPFKRPVKAYNLGDLGMKVIKTGKELDSWLSNNADNYLVRFDAVSKETGRQVSDSTGQTMYEKGSQDYEVLNATIPLPEGKSEIWVECSAFKGVMLPDEKYEVIDTGLAAANVMAKSLSGVASSGIQVGMEMEAGILGILVEALDHLDEGGAGDLIRAAIEAIKEANEAEKTSVLDFTFSATGGTGTALDCGKDHFSYDGYPGLIGRGVKIGDIGAKLKGLIPR